MKVESIKYNVLEALDMRLQGIYKSGHKMYLCFSGGKDSLVLGHKLYIDAQQGKYDPKRLEVIFVDEEAIYPCVERIVKDWREKFLSIGAAFHWLCLPFKHFNCFNSLYNDESFILWDPEKKDKWIRQPPEFAIRKHKKYQEGDTYQDFLDRIKDGYALIGLRMSESVQRYTSIEAQKESIRLYPIADWKLNDIWLYLYENNIETPDAYLYMWKTGTRSNMLRISQFFSIDTAPSLVKMMEYYPNLYEKILEREPNAYLAMYYWDSTMFRRMTNTRKEFETESVNWQEKFYRLYHSYEDKGRLEYRSVRRLIIKYTIVLTHIQEKKRQAIYRKLYEALDAGDPKRRTLRAVEINLKKARCDSLVEVKK